MVVWPLFVWYHRYLTSENRCVTEMIFHLPIKSSLSKEYCRLQGFVSDRCLAVKNSNKDTADGISYLVNLCFFFLNIFGRFKEIPASFSSAVVWLSLLLFLTPN